MKPSISFDDYVKQSILKNNMYGILDVNYLKSIKSLYFIQEEYSHIEQLIQLNNIEKIIALPENQTSGSQYIEIMIFKDQNSKSYIVTVYDSAMLNQDPQVIEIYPLREDFSF